jgi:hypothetical protein
MKVAVNEGVARLLSFLENNHIVHRPISLTVTQLVISWQIVLCFVGMGCLKMTTFEEHSDFECWMFSFATYLVYK